MIVDRHAPEFIKPSKVLEFTVNNNHSMAVYALGKNRIATIEGVEYLFILKQGRRQENGQVLITFWLYEPPNNNNDDELREKLEKRGEDSTHASYVKFRVYEKIEFIEIIKNSLGFLLFDYKENSSIKLD